MSSFGQRWLAAIPAAIAIALVTWCRMERDRPSRPEIHVPEYHPIQRVNADAAVARDAATPATARTWPVPHALPPIEKEARRKLFPVKVDGKYGFIDARGTLVIQPSFRDAGPFYDGRALVGERGARGFIDETGTLVVPANLESAVSFMQGLAAAQRDGLWGYVDRSGTFVVPPVFDYAGAFFEGFANVKLGGKWNLLSRVDASVVSPTGFESTGYFGGGLGPVKIGGKWGYVDPHGTIVIEPKFDEAWPFGSDRAPVKLGDKWGYIDRTGTLVVPAKYDDASHYDEHGLATVAIGKRYTVIDATGKPLFAAISSTRIWFDDDTNLAEATLGDRTDRHPVLIDRGGRVVLDDKRWTWYEAAGAGLFKVGDAQDREGYIDRTGRLIWKPTK